MSLGELEAGTRTGGFDSKGAGFSKKENRGNRLFIIIAAVLAVVIVGLLIYAYLSARK